MKMYKVSISVLDQETGLPVMEGLELSAEVESTQEARKYAKTWAENNLKTGLELVIEGVTAIRPY